MELLLLHASHQPAGPGPGSAEGRKLINEQMIYGDREKIENRDVEPGMQEPAIKQSAEL